MSFFLKLSDQFPLSLLEIGHEITVPHFPQVLTILLIANPHLKRAKSIPSDKNYNSAMDIEKSLTETIDPNFLLKDNFTINEIPSEIFVYEDSITFINHYNFKSIDFTPEVAFEIIYQDERCVGIKIFNGPDEVYEFVNTHWTHAEMWENFLIKKIKQRNFHQYYKPLKKIGKGNFASVYLAQNKKNDSLVAVKAFVKELAFKKNGKMALENQIAMLRKFSNPHIMKLYGVYETGNSLYMVLEYVDGMTLENYLRINQGRVNYEQRRSIMRMLIKALADLEKHGILHRDLKPDNIMISKDGKNLKLVDFGLATETNLDKYIFVRCGTPGYVAPEILRIRDDEKPDLECISDMFSLGSIFYQMLFERRLFNAVDHDQVLNQNRACLIKFTQEMKSSISFDEADLLQKMLALDPKKRISAFQALEHSYISDKHVNIFGSVRDRISKPIYVKTSKKHITTSLEKGNNLHLFKSLQK